MADFVAGYAIQDQDCELVEGLRGGCGQAFDVLMAQYQQPVYNFVFRLLEDPSDAPDVTQEVFLKVFRNIGKFRGDCSLKTWLYRIAVNEASNLRRWFARHRGREFSLVEKESGPLAVAETLADPQESQYEMVLRNERRRVIEAALSQVPECFRVAVVLRDMEGLSYEEIAELMQVSLGTVKSRILRGRRGLKERLAGLVAESSLPACVLPTMERSL